MITLYAFGQIFPEGIGETKDLRAQWALEETGLPYRVQAQRHEDGDLDKPAFVRVSPFHQIPAIDDDGFTLTESAAIALYLAEKSGKLIPADMQGRLDVTRWCFAAVSTVSPVLDCMDMAHIFDAKSESLDKGLRETAGRWFAALEARLDGRTWIATDEFTAADLMLAGVLRNIRHTDLLQPYPRLTAYVARCFARPAWERTLAAYAERLGTTVDKIR